VPDFNDILRQAQAAQQQAIVAAWPYWLLLFSFWAASTGLGVYVTIHFVALLKSVKTFMDAKTEQIKTSTTSTNPFSRSPEIRNDDDQKYRPKM
jgi:hypothetical protein